MATECNKWASLGKEFLTPDAMNKNALSWVASYQIIEDTWSRASEDDPNGWAGL